MLAPVQPLSISYFWYFIKIEKIFISFTFLHRHVDGATFSFVYVFPGFTRIKVVHSSFFFSNGDQRVSPCCFLTQRQVSEAGWLDAGKSSYFLTTLQRSDRPTRYCATTNNQEGKLTQTTAGLMINITTIWDFRKSESRRDYKGYFCRFVRIIP